MGYGTIYGLDRERPSRRSGGPLCYESSQPSCSPRSRQIEQTTSESQQQLQQQQYSNRRTRSRPIPRQPAPKPDADDFVPGSPSPPDFLGIQRRPQGFRHLAENPLSDIFTMRSNDSIQQGTSRSYRSLSAGSSSSGRSLAVSSGPSEIFHCSLSQSLATPSQQSYEALPAQVAIVPPPQSLPVLPRKYQPPTRCTEAPRSIPNSPPRALATGSQRSYESQPAQRGPASHRQTASTFYQSQASQPPTVTQPTGHAPMTESGYSSDTESRNANTMRQSNVDE